MNIKQIVNVASFYAKKVKNGEFKTNRTKQEKKSANQNSLTRLKNNQKAEFSAELQTQCGLDGLRKLRGLRVNGMRGLRSARFAEYGRSMVEMLGVLAVIGILSITAIWGYRYAMTKYIANETIYEINLRARDISFDMEMMIKNNYVGDIEMKMGPITRMGYPITARTSPQYIDYFEIFVKEVPTDVCKELLRMPWRAPYSIFVGVEEFEANIDICEQADKVELVYEFYKDLSSEDEIDEDEQHEIQRCNHDNNCSCGTCNTSTGLCESYCLDSQTCKKDYDDPRWMVCCDKDYILGEYCCASITDDGKCCNREGGCCPIDKPLMDMNRTCHSCDDISGIKLDDSNLCSVVCPDRFLTNATAKRCALCGVKGTAVADKPIWDYNGNCYSCDESKKIDGGSTPAEVKATEANCNSSCPNRIAVEKYCVIATCEDENQQLDGDGTCRDKCPKDMPLRDRYGNCYSCEENSRIDVSYVTQNCSVCLNRELEGNYCGLKECPKERPLMDKYGVCHSCDEEDGVALDDSNLCSVVCPDRFLTNATAKRCALCGVKGTAVADKPIWDYNGNCYSCDEPKKIDGGSTATEIKATEANCNSSCPNRIAVEKYCVIATCEDENQQLDGDGTCRDKCPKDMPLRDRYGNCYSCEENSRIDVSYVTQNCSVCLNRELEGNYCGLKECPKERPLMDKYGVCHSCDEEDGVALDDSNLCSVCPDRFLTNAVAKRCALCGVKGTAVADKPIWDYNGNCYSCDEPKKIDGGSTPAEVKATEANCNSSCPNRTMDGIYCILETCSSGSFLGQDLSCYPCNITSSIDSTEKECRKCINRVYENGKCKYNGS